MKKRTYWIASIILIFAIAVWGFTAFQQISLARLQSQSLSNAKTIGLACRMYASDHQGNFPTHLKGLVPDYLPDAKWLLSPVNSKDPIGYTYHSGYKDTDAGDIILIEDKYFGQIGTKITVNIDQSGRVQSLLK